MKLWRYVFDYRGLCEFALLARSRADARARLAWIMRDGGRGWAFKERMAA